MATRLHSGKACLDAFAYHQLVVRLTEPYCATTARAEHHPWRLDGRLARTVASEKSSVDSKWRPVSAARHRGYHRRPGRGTRVMPERRNVAQRAERYFFDT